MICLDKTSYNRNLFQNKSYQGTKQTTGKTVICFFNAFYTAFVSVEKLFSLQPQNFGTLYLLK